MRDSRQVPLIGTVNWPEYEPFLGEPDRVAWILSVHTLGSLMSSAPSLQMIDFAAFLPLPLLTNARTWSAAFAAAPASPGGSGGPDGGEAAGMLAEGGGWDAAGWSESSVSRNPGQRRPVIRKAASARMPTAPPAMISCFLWPRGDAPGE